MQQYCTVTIKEKLLHAFEEADADVIADYGEFYGSEAAFSRDRIKEIICSVFADYPNTG